MYRPEFFKEDEFYNFEKMNPILVFMLDKIRKKCGEYLDCSFHTLSTNEPHHTHGDNSRHYIDGAADFWIKIKVDDKLGITNQYIANMLYAVVRTLVFINNIGFGVYINSKGYMSFHIDYRDTHGSWMALSKNEKGGWNYETLNLDKIN